MVTPGLEGVIAAETSVSLVDGQNGLLVYRGHWAKELAVQHSFEEVCFLLWYDTLPNEEELERHRERLTAAREVDQRTFAILQSLSKRSDVMSAIRTALSSLGPACSAWPPTVEDAVRLTAVVPTLIAYFYRMQNDLAIVEPRKDLDHVSNYLYMLHGSVPSQAHSRALESYCILTMEHGMNASTFAARVVLSTQSDIVSALCGAIGAMMGPLHGGAPSEVMDMLDQIGGKSNAEVWLRNRLDMGKRLMGFGHRIYKTRDPRAEALKTVVQTFSKDDPWFDLAAHVEEAAIKLLEEYKPGRKLYTNVEFYAAAVLRAVSIPPQLFTPTFTASRMVGWTAHILEQSVNNRIFRPQSHYVGKMPDS